jgi:hypothetical protein
MADKKLVVRAVDAKCQMRSVGGLLFTKSAFVVTYPCPKCKSSLNSKGEMVDVGDSCPHCRAAYDFDAEIKQAYSDFQTKVSLERMQRQAEHRAREQQVIQEQRKKADALEEQARLARARVARDRIAYANAEVATRRQLSTSESALNAIETGYTAISFALSLILGLTFVGLGASFLLITKSRNGAQADLGVWMLLFCLGAGVSLIGFWWLLALLVSMHRLLFRILEELLVQNKDR